MGDSAKLCEKMKSFLLIFMFLSALICVSSKPRNFLIETKDKISTKDPVFHKLSETEENKDYSDYDIEDEFNSNGWKSVELPTKKNKSNNDYVDDDDVELPNGDDVELPNIS